MPQAIRNIAIILALAAAVDFLPGGGKQLTLASLSDGRKAGLFGAVGAIALLVVAYDDFSSWAGGLLLWIALMAACIGTIFLIWRSTTTY